MVSPRPGLARATRQPWLSGLATVLTCACAFGLTPMLSASADTAAEVQARADAAAAKVHALQDDVDRARQQYQYALDGLAGRVTTAMGTEQQAEAAAAQAQLAEYHRAQALRAITQSGDSLDLVNIVLSSDSPSDIAAQWLMGQQVLDVLAVQSEGVQQYATSAQKRAKHASKLADHAVATVSQVEAAYDQLQDLMDQQQAILDQLDSRARHLAKAEQAAADLANERNQADSAASESASHVTVMGIPKNFLQLYQSAATTCHGMNWTVLAAVGQVESGHGANNGPSSSGAEGPMQFLPSTFAAYAVDGDGDGDKDIWSPADSIYTAAHYLCANGAGRGPRGLYSALWNYNHADWYVQMVAAVAVKIARQFHVPAPTVESS